MSIQNPNPCLAQCSAPALTCNCRTSSLIVVLYPPPAFSHQHCLNSLSIRLQHCSHVQVCPSGHSSPQLPLGCRMRLSDLLKACDLTKLDEEDEAFEGLDEIVIEGVQSFSHKASLSHSPALGALGRSRGSLHRSEQARAGCFHRPASLPCRNLRETNNSPCRR